MRRLEDVIKYLWHVALAFGCTKSREEQEEETQHVIGGEKEFGRNSEREGKRSRTGATIIKVQ